MLNSIGNVIKGRDSWFLCLGFMAL